MIMRSKRNGFAVFGFCFYLTNHIWYTCSEANSVRRLLLRSGFTREGTCPKIALGNSVFIYNMKGEQHSRRYFTRRKTKLAVQLAGLVGTGEQLHSCDAGSPQHVGFGVGEKTRLLCICVLLDHLVYKQ